MARIEMTTKTKRILAVSIAILIIALSLIVVFSQSLASNSDTTYSNWLRVACIGDSITNMTDYPADLQALLGKKFGCWQLWL